MSNYTLKLKRRPKAEVVAFYDGQIASYMLLLKMWPVKEADLLSYLKVAEAMRQNEIDTANP